LVRVQGGDTGSIENLETFPLSRFSLQVKADSDGFLSAIDALEVGFTSITLGAGRQKLDDAVDPKAGILLRKKVGNKVESGDVLAEIFTDRQDILTPAKNRLHTAFRITPHPPKPAPLILNMVDESGVHPWTGENKPS
ncbi:MAG TPA: thymidine phosphorylase, partial [Bacteroidota bacterium]